MRYFGIAIATLLAFGIAAAVRAAEEEDATPPQRLEQSYHAPLEDPDLGRLYEPAAELLKEARQMPETLREFEPPPPAEEEAAPEPAALEEPPPLPERWISAVDGLVGDEEDLAAVYYKAGSYERAARTYRRLLERDPDSEHLVVMLLLSEANTGNSKEATKLLRELDPQSPRRSWAEWLLAIKELGSSETEVTP